MPGYGYGNRLGRLRRAGGGGAPVPTAPANWRMPATVSTSSGLSADQTALAAAQASDDSKTRPAVTLTNGSNEFIEWTVQSEGDALLSFVPSTVNGTYTIAKNGVSVGYTKQFPTGSDEVGNSNTGKFGRRQVVAIPVVADDVIRLSIVATGTLEVRPLLHLKPATGPWDATLIFGASNEDYGLASRSTEDAIIAAHPNRDPIVFNWGRAGYNLSNLATEVALAAPIFDGTASYAYCGSVMGNTITADRPWDSSQTAAMQADLGTIRTALEGAGMQVWFASTSYRIYPGDVITDQSTGSLPYDTNVLFPFLTANLPYCMDAALGRARIDTYLFSLPRRANLTDTVHWNSSFYGQHQAFLARRFFGFLYGGVWNGENQIEEAVAAAEAGATSESTALSSYTEATYAMVALPASAAKTALQARLDAVYPTTLFFEAKRLIGVAEAATTQMTKDAAQAGLDAAETAGYVDAASPNTIAEQQARIDAIVIASYDQVVNVGFGATGPAVAGWNRFAPGNSSGVIASGLLDDTGATTALGLNVTNAGTGNSNNTAQTSAIASIPSGILSATWTDTANLMELQVTGCDVGELYTLELSASRTSGAATSVRFTVNGDVISPDIVSQNNTTQSLIVPDVAPDGSGVITVQAGRGAGSSFAYFTVLRVLRQA